MIPSFHHQFQIWFIELHLDQCFKCICSFSVYSVSSSVYLIMACPSVVVISPLWISPFSKINSWFTCQMIIAEEDYIFLYLAIKTVTACFYHVINVMIILKQLLQLKCMFRWTLSVHGGVCDTLLVGNSFIMLWFFCVWHAFLHGCVVVGWLLLFINMQNPGYMKENFFIIIESLHIADTGMQQNVSHRLCCWQSISWFLACASVS